MAKVVVPQVKRKNYDSEDAYLNAQHGQLELSIKKFNSEVAKEGILKEYRNRMFYISKGEKRRMAKKAGRRKQLKQMYKDRQYNSY